MVEFVDGSILAQTRPTDMRMPIQYALTYPQRVASNDLALDWSKLRRLDFAKVSTRRFPCLRLAREAMKKGGALRCALNAAMKWRAAFLERRLPFLVSRSNRQSVGADAEDAIRKDGRCAYGG